MDSVRFGRVLGKGARAAAKGLYEAVDAATAPNPNPSPVKAVERAAAPVERPVAPLKPVEALRGAVQTAADVHAVYQEQKRAVTREAGKAGRSILKPFVRAGGILWLEVTGTFFGLFALIFAGNVWKYHGALWPNATNAQAHHKLMGAVLVTVIFGYFAVTSFVRARKRARG